MRKQWRYIVVILFLLQSGIVWAQSNVEFIQENFPGQEDALKEALGDIADGDYFFDLGRGNTLVALEYYKEADMLNPSNALLKYKIGKCYLELKPTSDAIRYFKWALRIDSNITPEVYYHLGRAHHMDLNFQTAIIYYKKYKNSLNSEDLQRENKDIISKIEQAYFGQELYQNPVRVHIENLGKKVNTKFPDYHPIINADGSVLFFTSRRDNTMGAEKDEVDLLFYEDIYTCNFIDSAWQEAENIGTPINSRSHESVMGISPDGQTLLLYKAKGGGDIYESHLQGNKWTKPSRLGGGVNSKYQESSASYSYDGREIFIVSDRPGGYGGNDIWVCKRDIHGEWGDAVNLGRAVNTPDEEVSVFMHPDGKTLYFSSKGHASMGGFDVFKAVRIQNKWTSPDNLGYPINTPDDDVFFSISASGRQAYYSTNTPDGLGGHDLYLITYYGPEKQVAFSQEDNLIAGRELAVTEKTIDLPVEIHTMQLTLLKGQVTDARTRQPLSATIELVDNTSNEVIAEFISNSVSGKYIVTLPAGRNYGIAVQKEGYLFHSENFNIADSSDYNEVVINIGLQEIEVGSEITLNNIFFDYKKSTINKESRLELDRIIKLMDEYPSLKIEISGHTDNIGSAQYNKELSEKRAKSVVEYLVGNGITKNRLTSKGYGFEKPVENNETEEGRGKNRRSEFKIIEK